MMDINALYEFQRQSNAIEGIVGAQDREVHALKMFLAKAVIRLEDLIAYVAVIEPRAELRNRPEVSGVRVGDHIAPPSGVRVAETLETILIDVCFNHRTPYENHCHYLTLHPFTDGNGRSARALWLWQHGGVCRYPFLQAFYYETLAAHDKRDGI